VPSTAQTTAPTLAATSHILGRPGPGEPSGFLVVLGRAEGVRCRALRLVLLHVRGHAPGPFPEYILTISLTSPPQLLLPSGSGSGAGDAASEASLATSRTAGIAATEAELLAKIAGLQAKIDNQFGAGGTNKRPAGSTVVQFYLQFGADGERVEVRQQANSELHIGQNQLELLLIRAPADHALRHKYAGKQWKPRPQQLVPGGDWTSSHADWPAGLRVVERRTFIVPGV
jgi:hypothetical protein